MASIVAALAAEGGDSVTQVLQEAERLAHQVGPFWAFVLILTICLFLPRIGVVPHLAKLFAADQADKRKRTVEYQRLLVRFQSRSAPPVALPPSNPPALPNGKKKK